MGKVIRYLLLLALAPVCAIAHTSKDSTTTERTILSPQVSQVYKTNFLPAIWGAIPFTAEYRIIHEVPVGPYQSSQIGISYLGKSLFLTMLENNAGQSTEPRIKVSGFRFQFSHKFYFRRWELAPSGPYFGPQISYAQAKFSTRYLKQYDCYIEASHFNVNMLIGYQSIRANGYTVDFFTGIGYKKNNWGQHYFNKSVPIDVSDIPLYGSPLKFTLGFNIGYAF
jgi:hypothetical protein